MPAAQRVALGQAIAEVGRDAFIKALKQRLTNPARYGHKPFTFADVLNDAVTPEQPTSPSVLVVGGAVLGAGLVACLAFVPGAAVVLPFGLAVGGGTLWWMNRKIERWVQSVLDDYASFAPPGTGSDKHQQPTPTESERNRFS